MRELTVKHPAYIPVVRVIASFSFFLTSSHYRMYVKHTIKIIINEASELDEKKCGGNFAFLGGLLYEWISSTFVATLELRIWLLQSDKKVVLMMITPKWL